MVLRELIDELEKYSKRFSPNAKVTGNLVIDERKKGEESVSTLQVETYMNIQEEKPEIPKDGLISPDENQFDKPKEDLSVEEEPFFPRRKKRPLGGGSIYR